MSHKHGLDTKAVSKWQPPKSFKVNFFTIADTSGAETLVSGNVECLLAIGEDKLKCITKLLE